MTVWEMIRQLSKEEPDKQILIGHHWEGTDKETIASRVLSSKKFVHIDDGEIPL